MATYENLPGVNLELLDGNLRVDSTSDANRVLIIGRAEMGTSGRIYNVGDTNKAANTFGPESPLIRKMSEARLGGATEVSLYRIGGSPASLNGLWGEGSQLATVEESVAAGDSFRIYCGPRPSNDGKSCLIVFKGKNIVYSNVPGSEVDLNQVTVTGFDETTGVVIGTPTEPVLMSNIIPVTKKGESNHISNGVNTEFRLVGTTKTDNVTNVVVKVNDAEKASGSDYTLSKDTLNNYWKIKFNSAQDARVKVNITYDYIATGNEAGAAVFSGDGAKTKFVLAGTHANSQVTIDRVIVAGVDKTSEATVEASDDNLAKALVLQTAPGDQEAIAVDYTIAKTGSSVPGTFKEGKDSLNCTWKEYYEILYAGLKDLETVNAMSVVTDYAIVDAPNIASGSTAKDRLEYVYVSEEDGEYKFEWSTSKVVYRKGSGTTMNSAEADINGNGQPIVYRRYHEADFAHLLAEFAYNISENEQFTLVTIGTSVPQTTSTFAVNKWVGSAPTYDAAGNIITNGTGLLGVRHMVERADQAQGYYKTSSGFVDGVVQVDSNGANIDIGKYLSVVPQLVITPASSSTGTSTRITNAAAIYAGLLTTINAGNSTTNAPLPRLSLPFEMKKTKLNQLSGAGYVTFQTKNNVVRVVSGELATNINSDYDYVSTSIIINSVITGIRNVCIPYIGKGLTEATKVALDTAIESVLDQAVAADAVVKYAHVVNQPTVINGKGTLNVALTIVPAFELREVNVAVKLALDL